MEPSAVADILEDVPVAVEPAGADPAAAFAAHLADIFGIPVHQCDQEMAADPGKGLRSLWHLCRAVMRAARTEMRRALRKGGAVLARWRRQERSRPPAEIVATATRIQPRRHHGKQQIR